VGAVRAFAYPRHKHTMAIIDGLVDEGYLGARMGCQWAEEANSYGDFSTLPRNGWDEGISLFRVPTTASSGLLFGDHSADPPQHKTYAEFLAAAQPWIDQIRTVGGVFVCFDHHLGNDDDSYGDIDYSSGGVTAENLRWLVELVRASGGIVMTFGDMCQYYRERTVMVEIDGDLVWMPATMQAADVSAAGGLGLRAVPNPFNPRTEVRFDLDGPAHVRVTVHDLRGRRLDVLQDGVCGPGPQRLVWDGVDAAGRAVPSGSYLVRVEMAGGADARKILLAR